MGPAFTCPGVCVFVYLGLYLELVVAYHGGWHIQTEPICFLFGFKNVFQGAKYASLIQ